MSLARVHFESLIGGLSKDVADAVETFAVPTEPAVLIQTTEVQESASHYPEHPTLRLVDPQESTLNWDNCLHHPSAHPIFLDLFFLKTFGDEYLEWEPETLFIAAAHEHHELSYVNYHKVQAARTMHMRETPAYQRWEVFGFCILALMGVPPNADVIQTPTAYQLTVGVDIMRLLHPEPQYSNEVKIYINTTLEFENVFFPPAPLDGFRPKLPSSISAEEFKRLWPEVLEKQTAAGETPTMEQLRRTLFLYDEVQHHRVLLKKQMELLKHVQHAQERSDATWAPGGVCKGRKHGAHLSC
jgi:hypothetical protein